ncbi:hypothetical protein ACFU96_46245 [Streptomyces sp. NPDC057620]|uniref:hypothetical protein n=1 Tax=Streptomyces sp. NPDC057620 TaxID=3346185 RepID=UPI0036C9A273
MPEFLIDGLADMSVARSLSLAIALFAFGACLLFLVIDVRHFVPARVRHALPMWLRVQGLRMARASARVRLALVTWLLARLDTTSSSAPKKGALR